MQQNRDHGRWRRLALGASLSSLVLGGWAAAAAGAPAGAPEKRSGATTYVGAVRGTDALIALVVDRTRAVGYVCDSTSIASRFAGGRRGSAFGLSTPRAGAYSYGRNGGEGRVGFRHNGRWASGTVTIAGRTHRFAATKAPPPAGYYRAEAGSLSAGWVIGADGQQRGAVIDRTTSNVVSAGPVELQVTTSLTVTVGERKTRASRVAAP